MGGTGGVPLRDSLSFSLDNWWFNAMSDCPATEGAAEGGVSDPLVGVRPLLASLEASVAASVEDLEVLKLALDRRLIDLMDSRLGAIIAAGEDWRPGCTSSRIQRRPVVLGRTATEGPRHLLAYSSVP